MEQVKKLTAVEWLVEQICGEHTDVWQAEIKRAKELEIEQMIEFGDAYATEWLGYEYNAATKYYDEYYNFKKL